MNLPSEFFASLILSRTSCGTPLARKESSERSLMRNEPVGSISGRTSFASPSFAAENRIRNDNPVSVIPIAIFVGVEGSLPLLSSHFQNHTSGKVNVTIQNGLMAFEIVPVTFQSVLSSAQ